MTKSILGPVFLEHELSQRQESLRASASASEPGGGGLSRPRVSKGRES